LLRLHIVINSINFFKKQLNSVITFFVLHIKLKKPHTYWIVFIK